MSIGVIIAIIIGVLVLLLVAGIIWWIVSANNMLATKRNNMLDSFDRLDKLLHERYADISACVEALGEHCDTHTREQVLYARNLAMQTQDLNERVTFEANLEVMLAKLLAIYEEKKLALDENTRELFAKLNKDMDFIDYERQFYNALASSYNLRIVAFPGKIMAKKKNWDTMPLFILQPTKNLENDI